MLKMWLNLQDVAAIKLFEKPRSDPVKNKQT